MKWNKKTMSLGMKMSFRDFFRTFLATTISIVLTFGTSAVLERREKKQSQKQMCMMLLHDIDESMEVIKESAKQFDQLYALQQQFRQNPSDWEDMEKRIKLISVMPSVQFNESFEKIFNSSPDIWSTIDDAVFIDNVNECYQKRQSFKDKVLSELNDLQYGLLEAPVDKFLNADVVNMAGISKMIAIDMEQCNEYNKRLMGISEKDMNAFVKRTVVDYNQQYYDSLNNVYMEEMMSRYNQ